MSYTHNLVLRTSSAIFPDARDLGTIEHRLNNFLSLPFPMFLLVPEFGGQALPLLPILVPFYHKYWWLAVLLFYLFLCQFTTSIDGLLFSYSTYSCSILPQVLMACCSPILPILVPIYHKYWWLAVLFCPFLFQFTTSIDGLLFSYSTYSCAILPQVLMACCSPILPILVPIYHKYWWLAVLFCPFLFQFTTSIDGLLFSYSTYSCANLPQVLMACCSILPILVPVYHKYWWLAILLFCLFLCQFTTSIDGSLFSYSTCSCASLPQVLIVCCSPILPILVPVYKYWCQFTTSTDGLLISYSTCSCASLPQVLMACYSHNYSAHSFTSLPHVLMACWSLILPILLPVYHKYWWLAYIHFYIIILTLVSHKYWCLADLIPPLLPILVPVSHSIDGFSY